MAVKMGLSDHSKTLSVFRKVFFAFLPGIPFLSENPRLEGLTSLAKWGGCQDGSL
jgi:hypothetical protein